MLFSAPSTIPRKGECDACHHVPPCLSEVSFVQFAIRLLSRPACSFFLLACLTTGASALDLSVPKDILDEGGRPPPERAALMGEESGSEGNPPEVSLYTHNVKEIIKRRMQAFPRDSAGRAICGEARYAMVLKPDGSIDRLEVIPVRPGADASGSLETFFVQPTIAGRNAGSAQHTQRIETDEENLRAFAHAIEDRLHSIAPYPARLQRGTPSPEPNVIQTQIRLVLVTGNIGVKCKEWEVNRQ